MVQPSPTRPKVNRLRQFLLQVEDYWFRGPQRKFAQDVGVSESTMSRVIRGVSRPSYELACRMARVLEKKLGRKIDPREIYEP
jgi:transcriptional regulator with XRE-family HTH domain